MANIPLGGIPSYYARTREGQVCLTYPEGSLTWKDLDENSNRRARLIRSVGVEHNDLVTIALPNGLAFHETIFAVWKLGATPHIISPALTRQEILEIVGLANPALVIGFDEELIPGCKSIPYNYEAQQYSSQEFKVKVADHWKAMSSGGSTGRPKIIVEHLSATWNSDLEIAGIPTDRTVLNPGPLYHNGPFVFSHVGLCKGNHVVGMTRFDARGTLDLLSRYKVTWVALVPTMLHRIWRLDQNERELFDLSSLRTILHTAAPMPVWLKEEWINWLGADRILEIYGGTEGTGSTSITGHEWLAHKGSVGKPLTGEIRILTDDGKDCGPRETGNVSFAVPAGTGANYHYMGAEPITIKEGWESLGDMGWMDEEGYLYLEDRRTDMIISGGANIYPAEVEAALLEHPGVESAIVIGMPDEDLGQKVHAIVSRLPEWESELDENSLSQFLSGLLVRYKTPRTFEFSDQLLRDDAGKARRSQLVLDRVTARTTDRDLTK